MNIQTQLKKKVASSPKACTQCKTKINQGEIYHVEEGIEEHIHSLIARNFCSNCYAKYGEKKLLNK